MQQFTLTRPDDWHIHLRDGDLLGRTVPHAAEQFSRVIAMPNLNPPVTTTELARQYQQRILAAVPAGSAFRPLMTLYLTEHTPPAEIRKAQQSQLIHAVKWYPSGATTNSQHGVKSIERCFDTLAEMEQVGLPLLVHPETTDRDVDTFDREAVFIESELAPVVERFPGLKVVAEHMTTSQAVDFVGSAPPQVAGTITAHHLLLNRNALFDGGLRPHHYCLPVLKREQHRLRLLAAATSGNPKFFLGTDSAPHRRHDKESACGCAGIYTAHAAIELYAEAFERAGALDKLEAFASFHGADFYGLPRNREQITLIRRPWAVPESYAVGTAEIVPFRSGESIAWQRLAADTTQV